MWPLLLGDVDGRSVRGSPAATGLLATALMFTPSVTAVPVVAISIPVPPVPLFVAGCTCQDLNTLVILWGNNDR